jgi:hypothetical protein
MGMVKETRRRGKVMYGNSNKDRSEEKTLLHFLQVQMQIIEKYWLQAILGVVF